MFRSIRALVLVATLVGASLTMIIGWATGAILLPVLVVMVAFAMLSGN